MLRIPWFIIRLCVLVLLSAALLLPNAARAEKTRLSVLLDWFVNPDHAALVVASEGGFFEKADLDVRLIAPADPNDPPKLVAAKRADIAISYQPQLHIQAAQGLPLVRFGTVVATPLNALVVLEDGPIRTLGDLRGRKIGYSVGGFETILLSAMFSSHGLALADVTLVNINFALSASLLSGRVDAVIGAFRNFELNQLDIEGRAGRAFYPEEHGVPVYDELILITHKDRLDDPALLDFLAALEAATLFILNHEREAWRLFTEYDSALDNELNRRAWRDTIPRLALRPAALDRARYQRFAAFARKNGLVKNTPPVEQYARDLSFPARP